MNSINGLGTDINKDIFMIKVVKYQDIYEISVKYGVWLKKSKRGRVYSAICDCEIERIINIKTNKPIPLKRLNKILQDELIVYCKKKIKRLLNRIDKDLNKTKHI